MLLFVLMFSHFIHMTLAIFNLCEWRSFALVRGGCCIKKKIWMEGISSLKDVGVGENRTSLSKIGQLLVYYTLLFCFDQTVQTPLILCFGFILFSIFFFFFWKAFHHCKDSIQGNTFEPFLLAAGAQSHAIASRHFYAVNHQLVLISK